MCVAIIIYFVLLSIFINNEINYNVFNNLYTHAHTHIYKCCEKSMVNKDICKKNIDSSMLINIKVRLGNVKKITIWNWRGPRRMFFLIFTDRKESWTRWKFARMFEQTFFSQLSNIPGQRAKLPRKFAHLRHTRSADTMDRMIKFFKSPFARTNWSNWTGKLRKQKHDSEDARARCVLYMYILSYA